MGRQRKDAPGVVIFTEWFEDCRDLIEDSQDAAELLFALCDYVTDGVIPDFEDNKILRTLFRKVRKQIEENRKSYLDGNNAKAKGKLKANAIKSGKTWEQFVDKMIKAGFTEDDCEEYESEFRHEKPQEPKKSEQDRFLEELALLFPVNKRKADGIPQEIKDEMYSLDHGDIEVAINNYMASLNDSVFCKQFCDYCKERMYIQQVKPYEDYRKDYDEWESADNDYMYDSYGNRRQ